MTNKEFFIEKIKEEQPIFVKVLTALPAGKLDYKPHEKARTAGRIAFQLASQPMFISGIVTAGAPDWGTYPKGANPTLSEMLTMLDKNFERLQKDLAKISDADWEGGIATLTFPGGTWEVKKYDMAWGFLFDAIHHRGQLTTYLRAMGEKVPSVYGGSADERSPTSSPKA
jgi:uncharacterized damage-inducible protein DinB